MSWNAPRRYGGYIFWDMYFPSNSTLARCSIFFLLSLKRVRFLVVIWESILAEDTQRQVSYGRWDSTPAYYRRSIQYDERIQHIHNKYV